MNDQPLKLLAGPRLKVKRAYKHINELHRIIRHLFRKSDFYSVAIEKDSAGKNYIVATVTASLPDDVPLVVGDALHNLKSALDLLYNDVVARHMGILEAPENTRFPIRNSREELVTAINGALKDKRIGQPVHDLIRDCIKPYAGGNDALWALHKLNITDKHKLIIPTMSLMLLDGITLQNEKQTVIEAPAFFMDVQPSGRFLLDIGGELVVKNKGEANATVMFEMGQPCEGTPVLQALERVSEEVSGTIKAFELLIFG